MKVVEEGHIYELDQLDAPDGAKRILVFVNRGATPHPGTINQEVIRALIHRVKFLEAELHHDVNPRILHHLRMALVLHEGRAAERKVERGKLEPEHVVCDPADGHFRLELDGCPSGKGPVSKTEAGP